MKTLYLIRHGESEANVNSQIYFAKNDHQIELSPLGIDQAKLCGKSLVNKLKGKKECSIFYSPFLRAKHTADVIDQEFVLAGIYGEMIEEPLIVERAWGHLNNIIDTTEFDRTKHFDFFYRPVGGESFLECYQRVILFFRELRRMSDDLPDTIIVVSHGEWMRLALMYLRRYTIEYFIEYRDNPKNCEIIEFSEFELK